MFEEYFGFVIVENSLFYTCAFEMTLLVKDSVNSRDIIRMLFGKKFGTIYSV